MKIHCVEFTMFNAVEWKWQDIEIRALSKSDLIQSVIDIYKEAREPDNIDAVLADIYDFELTYPTIRIK